LPDNKLILFVGEADQMSLPKENNALIFAPNRILALSLLKGKNPRISLAAPILS
jgi:hypothetical protein